MTATSAGSASGTKAELLRPVAIVLACLALALVTATAPATGGALATLAGLSAVTAAMVLGGRVPPLVWPVVALAGLAITALWPTAGVVTAAVLTIVVLAIRVPAYGYLGALLLLGCEGSIKMRLTVEGAPSPLAVGAALIDLALIISLAGLMSRGGWRTLRKLGARFGRYERLVPIALAVWVALAALQIPLGDSLSNGVEGFRLVHFYVPTVLGGALLAARVPPQRLGTLLLALIAAIATYAAFRGIVGPTENEREFAESRATGTFLGEHHRDTGSFTSPVALASFVVPAGVFALALACLEARRRIFSAAVFGLSMIGTIASYVRTALVAVVAGAVALAALVATAAGVPRALKLGAVGLVVMVLAGGYGATLLAGDVDEVAKHRAESLANPFTDYSVRARLKTWNRSFQKVVDQPLGTGTGTVGRATIKSGGRKAIYTDNSYLKVLQEQGFLGGALFIFTVVGAVVVCWRRLGRRGPLSAPLASAALVAFAAFLVLCLMGEYIEQPGKAFVWTLLGIATWGAFER